MPWVPIPDVLKRLRQEAKLDPNAAARKLKVARYTVERHELPPPRGPKTLKEEMVEAYEKHYKCERSVFAVWVPEDDPRLARTDEEGQPAYKKPRIRKLTELAAHERKIGEDKRVLNTAAGPLVLVGNHIFLDCEIGWKRYATDGKPYAIRGTVDELRAIPPPAEAQLGIAAGLGGVFRVGRSVVKSLNVSLTVFTVTDAHSALLQRCHYDERPVLLKVRVVARPAQGEWKGFLHFDPWATKLQPRPWCFVVDEVLEPSFLAPEKAK